MYEQWWRQYVCVRVQCRGLHKYISSDISRTSRYNEVQSSYEIFAPPFGGLRYSGRRYIGTDAAMYIYIMRVQQYSSVNIQVQVGMLVQQHSSGDMICRCYDVLHTPLDRFCEVLVWFILPRKVLLWQHHHTMYIHCYTFAWFTANPIFI